MSMYILQQNLGCYLQHGLHSKNRSQLRMFEYHYLQRGEGTQKKKKREFSLPFLSHPLQQKTYIVQECLKSVSSCDHKRTRHVYVIISTF